MKGGLGRVVQGKEGPGRGGSGEGGSREGEVAASRGGANHFACVWLSAGSFRGNAVGPEGSGPPEVLVWAFLVSFCSAPEGPQKAAWVQTLCVGSVSAGARWKVSLRWANTDIAALVTDTLFWLLHVKYLEFCKM